MCAGTLTCSRRRCVTPQTVCAPERALPLHIDAHYGNCLHCAALPMCVQCGISCLTCVHKDLVPFATVRYPFSKLVYMSTAGCSGQLPPACHALADGVAIGVDLLKQLMCSAQRPGPVLSVSCMPLYLCRVMVTAFPCSERRVRCSELRRSGRREGPTTSVPCKVHRGCYALPIVAYSVVVATCQCQITGAHRHNICVCACPTRRRYRGGSWYCSWPETSGFLGHLGDSSGSPLQHRATAHGRWQEEP